MTTLRALNDTERSLLALALTTSASRWNELGALIERQNAALAEQLHSQAEQARTLAANIGNADQVIFDETPDFEPIGE